MQTILVPLNKPFIIYNALCYMSKDKLPLSFDIS